jgi:hypothetical protein
MLAGTVAAADTEIHRCLLEDGTIAFQETPCPEPAVHVDNGSEAGEIHSESSTPAADHDDFDNPLDERTLPESLTPDRAECEKTTRDAIDAIDLEMRTSTYTKERGKEYLAELLALTQQLRTCKRL